MATTSKNIVLVGPMGSGKTTIGRRLAHELNRDFFDTDHEIIDKTGVTIDHIFDIEGEEGFRERESKILENFCQMSNIILATGGGIVILPKNRKILQNVGLVVYLSSSVDQLLRRTAKSKSRLDTRDIYYREVASVVIDTTGKNLHEVIKIIKREAENVE